MLRQIAQSPSIIKLEARMVKKNRRKNKMEVEITTITSFWNYFRQLLCSDKSQEILLDATALFKSANQSIPLRV